MSDFNMNVEIRGLQSLLNKANKRILHAPMRQFFIRSLTTMQSAQKGLAPVDTGRLRNSIVYEVDSSPMPRWGKTGTNVVYAPYQEFGTGRGIRPRRYMRGGFEASVQSINGFLERAARDIEGAWG